MIDKPGARHIPLVLLVNHQEWTARSVESVLRPAGYAVVKAYTGRQATEVAARLRPDLVIVDYKLSDALGLDTCRAIAQLPTVDPATPFIIATAASLSRQERHECFRAGIWDIFSSPFDPVELVGKLETFLGARRQIEAAWESTHSDPATGLYNWNGMLARATEMVADAHRSGRWTGCVALGTREVSPEGPAGESTETGPRLYRSDPAGPELLERITSTLVEATRESDPTGVLGGNDFLVLAPGTDEDGASVLAHRLVDTLNEHANSQRSSRPEVEFLAGYYSARDPNRGGLVAQDLLGRTIEALRTVQKAGPGSPAVLPFKLA